MTKARARTYCNNVSVAKTRVWAFSACILPKVHVQIAVEDTISLRRVKVPNELTVSQRSRWRHHLTHRSVSHPSENQHYHSIDKETIHSRHKSTRD
jgi:hypothetical protein